MEVTKAQMGKRYRGLLFFFSGIPLSDRYGVSFNDFEWNPEGLTPTSRPIVLFCPQPMQAKIISVLPITSQFVNEAPQ